MRRLEGQPARDKSLTIVPILVPFVIRLTVVIAVNRILQEHPADEAGSRPERDGAEAYSAAGLLWLLLVLRLLLPTAEESTVLIAVLLRRALLVSALRTAREK